MKELSLCHKSQFSIPISLKQDGVNLWYFKLWLFDPSEFIVWNIYGSTTLGCRDKGIKKSEFVAITQFLCQQNMMKFCPFLKDDFIEEIAFCANAQ